MVTTSFTPIASAIGGALIGLAAVMLMAFTGRIAGVSGIASRLLPPYEDKEFAGRLAFVAGLVAAPLLVWLVTGSLPGQTIAGRRAGSGRRRATRRLRFGLGQWLHLRPRRLRAVAALDALAGRHRHLHGHGDRDRISRAALGVGDHARALQFVIGLIFGLGLLVSGMSDPAKVLNFLDLGGIRAGTWDPSLAFVMAGAIAVTFIGYKLVLKRSQPLFAEKFYLPGKADIDRARDRWALRSSASAGGLRAFARVPP